MSYRTVRPEDLPLLFRLERAYMQEVEPDSVAGWTNALDRNLELWIDCLPTSGAITDEDGTVTGLAVWQLQPAVATLVAVHVVPERRGAGVGGRLLEGFVGAATAGGVPTAALGVHESNTRAERLYTSHGFCHIGSDGAYRLFERSLTV
ncbi:GNAT family N-acetyltransferase [Curtobacterium sp. 1P10AnD]|uniref:GNAT family N-acetyltransferase n=1 Tax=unclassified Curtobacterium TaxID=257496 RepID=UPI0003B709E0|nr:GNAT family N-acetyltransferase [Curtobacterium sp. B18]